MKSVEVGRIYVKSSSPFLHVEAKISAACLRSGMKKKQRRFKPYFNFLSGTSCYFRPQHIVNSTRSTSCVVFFALNVNHARMFSMAREGSGRRWWCLRLDSIKNTKIYRMHEKVSQRLNKALWTEFQFTFRGLLQRLSSTNVFSI